MKLLPSTPGGWPVVLFWPPVDEEQLAGVSGVLADDALVLVVDDGRVALDRMCAAAAAAGLAYRQRLLTDVRAHDGAPVPCAPGWEAVPQTVLCVHAWARGTPALALVDAVIADVLFSEYGVECGTGVALHGAFGALLERRSALLDVLADLCAEPRLQVGGPAHSRWALHGPIDDDALAAIVADLPPTLVELEQRMSAPNPSVAFRAAVAAASLRARAPFARTQIGCASTRRTTTARPPRGAARKKIPPLPITSLTMGVDFKGPLYGTARRPHVYTRGPQSVRVYADGAHAVVDCRALSPEQIAHLALALDATQPAPGAPIVFRPPTMAEASRLLKKAKNTVAEALDGLGVQAVIPITSVPVARMVVDGAEPSAAEIAAALAAAEIAADRVEARDGAVLIINPDTKLVAACAAALWSLTPVAEPPTAPASAAEPAPAEAAPPAEEDLDAAWTAEAIALV